MVTSYKTYHIEWIDSAERHGWTHNDDEDGRGCSHVTTVGQVIRETDSTITVSIAVSEDGALSPLTIPKVAITRMELVHVSRARRTPRVRQDNNS